MSSAGTSRLGAMSHKQGQKVFRGRLTYIWFFMGFVDYKKIME